MVYKASCIEAGQPALKCKIFFLESHASCSLTAVRIFLSVYSGKKSNGCLMGIDVVSTRPEGKFQSKKHSLYFFAQQGILTNCSCKFKLRVDVRKLMWLYKSNIVLGHVSQYLASRHYNVMGIAC